MFNRVALVTNYIHKLVRMTTGVIVVTSVSRQDTVSHITVTVAGETVSD